MIILYDVINNAVLIEKNANNHMIKLDNWNIMIISFLGASVFLK